MEQFYFENIEKVEEIAVFQLTKAYQLYAEVDTAKYGETRIFSYLRLISQRRKFS